MTINRWAPTTLQYHPTPEQRRRCALCLEPTDDLACSHIVQGSIYEWIMGRDGTREIRDLNNINPKTSDENGPYLACSIGEFGQKRDDAALHPGVAGQIARSAIVVGAPFSVEEVAGRTEQHARCDVIWALHRVE